LRCSVEDEIAFAEIPSQAALDKQHTLDLFAVTLARTQRSNVSRTVGELCSVVADCLSAFTAKERRHDFEAAGYNPE